MRAAPRPDGGCWGGAAIRRLTTRRRRRRVPFRSQQCGSRLARRAVPAARGAARTSPGRRSGGCDLLFGAVSPGRHGACRTRTLWRSRAVVTPDQRSVIANLCLTGSAGGQQVKTAAAGLAILPSLAGRRVLGPRGLYQPGPLGPPQLPCPASASSALRRARRPGSHAPVCAEFPALTSVNGHVGVRDAFLGRRVAHHTPAPRHEAPPPRATSATGPRSPRLCWPARLRVPEAPPSIVANSRVPRTVLAPPSPPGAVRRAFPSSLPRSVLAHRFPPSRRRRPSSRSRAALARVRSSGRSVLSPRAPRGGMRGYLASEVSITADLQPP